MLYILCINSVTALPAFSVPSILKQSVLADYHLRKSRTHDVSSSFNFTVVLQHNDFQALADYHLRKSRTHDFVLQHLCFKALGDYHLRKSRTHDVSSSFSFTFVLQHPCFKDFGKLSFEEVAYA